jgi:hypothetical protein
MTSSSSYNAAADLVERNLAAGRGGKTAYVQRFPLRALDRAAGGPG